ncbi:MAG: hypothetical protein JWN56_845 [Sphingobacteriales bacterium]|nr:hypothetical protein [Sphingobacteriales bacterium]
MDIIKYRHCNCVTTVVNRTISIFLLGYYLVANLCSNTGDFSAILELPNMYNHCKATEDKDMTPIDFVTDHLVNIDCLFDKHDNGDSQKPHLPLSITHKQTQTFFLSQVSQLKEAPVSITVIKSVFFYQCSYFFNHHSYIFHPPSLVNC